MSRTIFGVTIAFLLLFSYVLVFEMKLPEVNAALFSDDFANMSNWTVVKGGWTSAEGVLQGTSAVGGEGLIWAGDTGWTNYEVTAYVRVVNSSEGSLVVRYSGPTDFYWLGLGCWGHKYSISKVVNGVYQELGSLGVVGDVEVGRWYLVSAVAVDGTLQLFVDGVKVLEVQDGSLSNGAIGIRDWAGTMQAKQLAVQSMGWSKTYGGTGNDEVSGILGSLVYGKCVIQTPDGGYAIAGTTSSFDNGNYSVVFSYVYLVKTDSAGNIQWNRTYGTGNEHGYSVAQTSDGGYVITGSTAHSYHSSYIDVYLVKTDSSGNMQWNKTYKGVTSDYIVSWGNFVVQTSDGGYIIIGNTVIPVSSATGTIYVIKTDTFGNMQWNKTYGSYLESLNDREYSAVQTTDGGYVITGKYTRGDLTLPGPDSAYLLKIDSSGNVQWKKSYGAEYTLNSVIQTSDGGYATSGIYYHYDHSDVYLVKTDSAGNMQWNKTYGVSTYNIGFSIVQTTDGGYAITGTTASLSSIIQTSIDNDDDVYLVKTDSFGNMLWQKTYGGTGIDIGYFITQTPDGGYAIAGTTNSFGAGGNDIWLVKVPADGAPSTVDNYDGLWHTVGFQISLTATDQFTSVAHRYYIVNDGILRDLDFGGLVSMPYINTEGADNKLEYWSVDSLGNVEPHHTLTGIKLDKTAPTGSIVIKNGDAFTASTSVTLTLTANDATSGVFQVRYSNDGVWDTEAWESAAASKAWTLTSGDGTKTVYYQAKDNAGLLSSTYSDTIILETTTPTPTPSPTSTPTPTASPTPSPSPTPTDTPTLTSTPTASPTPTPSPSTTPATPTLSPNQLPSPSPSPLSQTTETPLYIYAVAVLTISAISATTLILIRKKR